ncbi:MAG: caspase family protein, partial [Symploca sp. SIO2E6]|nr:caspase family protein [Symploca sp. SIO2E6]
MAGLFNKGYALLIGVGESNYKPLSLPVTVKDTQAIYATLIDPDLCAYPDDKEHIRVLNNAEASRSTILDGLKWLKEKAEADPEATVLVYYSGHGWVDKTDNAYYLLQHDVKPSKLAASALSAEVFTNALRKIQAERLLVIIDSCHAAG